MRRRKEEIPDDVRQWFSQHFCGCGNPDAAMALFKEILDWFPTPEEEKLVAGVISLEKIKEFEAKHGTALFTLMMYLFEGSDLMEHGGSIYGSWLTQLGCKVKNYLIENPDYIP